jgi:hypothetical protein
MKINELISSFEIFVTNEEKMILEKIQGPMSLNLFNEREQTLINNLIRKSVISKLKHGNHTLILKNEQEKTIT